ncbi:MAG: enoyl-CoA hydratase-related protein, partial [Candidatus Binatia bacterium]
MERRHTSYSVADGVAVLTLNRPDRMNAFTNTMLQEMIEAIREANRDDSVRAIVVTGAGKAFCAGADLGAGGKTFDAEAGGEDVGLTGHRDGGGQVTLE